MKFSIRNSIPLIALVLTAIVAGCSKTSSNWFTASEDQQSLRPLTESEALADYDAMVASIQSLYGPLEYKERRFQYDFKKEAAAIRAKFSTAKTDGEKQGLFFELLRLLDDGHVGLTLPIRERTEIPIVPYPVEGKFLVSKMDPTLSPYGIAIGDEILSVDGVTPNEALKIIRKYTWFANEQSDRHMIFLWFYRSFYMTELKPKDSFAQIEFLKPNGERKMARIPWRVSSPQLRPEGTPKKAEGEEEESADAASRLLPAQALTSTRIAERLKTEDSINLFQMGAPAPWYWNSKLKNKYGVTLITPERDIVLRFYNLWAREMNIFDSAPPEPKKLPDTLPALWAALYKYNGKTVLMIRQPGYVAKDYPLQLAMYSALIEQFQPLADALVIDQTHNPGGSVTYVESFAQLFAPNGLNGFVQFLNTDRRWFSELSEYWTGLDSVLATTAVGSRVLSYLKDFERDSDLGLRLGRTPFSFSLREVLPPAPGGAVWKKPLLVLIDELCGSGGDAFPMLVKANKLGRIFGNRTAGMGGSVEETLEMPFTRGKLNLTRGLFTTFRPDGKYTDADFVENNGVTPDVQYDHTVSDMRNGFDAYFQAFSAEATK